MSGTGEPTLGALWEEQAAAWAAFARDGDAATAFHLPLFLELLPPAGQATLDLGCGEGRVGRELARRGHRMTGVDSSPTLARLTREGGGYEAVVESDAAALPFADGSFDLVVAVMTLQDMDDMPGAVAEAARVLVPGGCFAAAITHPICTAGDFIGDPAASPFAIERPYATRARYRWHTESATGVPLELHGEHRPLEAYSRALEAAGFVLEALREPMPPAGFVEEHPETAYLARVPFFLHFRARRS